MSEFEPYYERFAREDQILPGKPIDYLGTEGWEHGELLKEPQVKAALERDPYPLPMPEARENYFGDKHLEYWLSGYRNFRDIVRATGIDKVHRPTILDHGGASGRLVRHFLQADYPGATLYLSDSNLQHVRLVNYLFEGRIAGIVSSGLPPLPLPENSVDLVTMMSVMTHIFDDITWLVELQRIVRPRGYVYATFHDEEAWRMMTKEDSSVYDLYQKTRGFADYIRSHPALTEQVAAYFSGESSNNCNVYHTAAYIRLTWGRYFEIVSITPQAAAHQAAVVMRSRKQTNTGSEPQR